MMDTQTDSTSLLKEECLPKDADLKSTEPSTFCPVIKTEPASDISEPADSSFGSCNNIDGGSVQIKEEKMDQETFVENTRFTSSDADRTLNCPTVKEETISNSIEPGNVTKTSVTDGSDDEIGVCASAEFAAQDAESSEGDMRSLAAEDLVEVVMEEGEPIPGPSQYMSLRGPRMSLRSASGGLKTLVVSSVIPEVGPRKKRQDGVRKTYLCDLCGFTCKKTDHLKAHMRSHTGEKPFVCEVCGSKFRQPHYLKEHQRIHTGEKPFVCSICGSTFRQAGNLRVHMKIHTGQKPFACDGCELKFSQRSQLKAHRRTHTGEKPYVCELCNSRFSHTANLRAHKRTHSGEKPYACDVCDSRFRESHHLKAHKRTHTGEKPYACDLCECKYSDPRHLKAHKRIHAD